MDYGWNKVLASADNDREDLASVRSGKSHHSFRSRMSYSGSITRGSILPVIGERTTLQDWTPPQAPIGSSHFSEDVQLDHLRRHSNALQIELEKHNHLRPAMTRYVRLHRKRCCVEVLTAFSIPRQYPARSANASKASANWEKKSKYILTEFSKYQTYVDALKMARAERQKRKDERKVKRLLEVADDDTATDDPLYSPNPAQTEFHHSNGPALSQPTSPDASARLDSRRGSTTTAHTTTTTDFYEAEDRSP